MHAVGESHMYYCKSREGSTPLFNLLTLGNNKYCLLTDFWPSAKTNLRTPTTRNPELPTQVRNLKHDNNFGGPRTEASFSRRESHCLKPPLIPVCCTAITARSVLSLLFRWLWTWQWAQPDTVSIVRMKHMFWPLRNFRSAAVLRKEVTHFRCVVRHNVNRHWNSGACEVPCATNISVFLRVKIPVMGREYKTYHNSDVTAIAVGVAITVRT